MWIYADLQNTAAYVFISTLQTIPFSWSSYIFVNIFYFTDKSIILHHSHNQSLVIPTYFFQHPV